MTWSQRSISTHAHGWLALCWMFLSIPSAVAQTGRPASGGTGGREEFSLEEITKLEMNYNQVVTDALSLYFSKGRYVIGVKIAVGTRSSEVESAVVTKKRESSDFELPALPVVPDEFKMKKRDDESQQESRYKTSLIIKSITVNATIDTSFTRAEQEFFIHAVGLAINLRPQRGDKVTIVRKAFPSTGVFMDTDGRGSGGGRERATGSGSDIPTGLILLVLGLAVIGGGVIYVAMKRSAPMDRPSRDPITVTVAPPPVSAGQNASTEQRQEPNTAASSLIVPEAADDRGMIYHSFMFHQQDLAQYITEKVSSGVDGGANDIAVVLRAVDPKLLLLYRSILPPRVFQQLEAQIQSVTYDTLKRSAAVLQSVRREIDEVLGDRTGSILHFQGFGFLRRMGHRQLERLCTAVADPDVCALILSHVNIDTARSVISAMDHQQADVILSKVPGIRKADAQWLQRWENDLFERCTQILRDDRESEEEIATTLSVLEMLPVSRQRPFIEELQRSNMDLAQRVREHTVFFDELDRFEIPALTAFLSGVPTETIAVAVAGAVPNVAEALLRTRLPRERAMIEQSNQSRSVPDPEAHERALNEILTVIRHAQRRSR